MPVRADGSWEQEDDSTSSKLNGLLKTDSPLMEQARTSGMKAANARGLANSSIAITASEDSLYRAATPIAQSDAQAVNAKNVAGLNADSQARLQTSELASREKLQGRDIEAQAGRLQAQIDEQRRAQAADIAAQSQRQQTDISAIAERQRIDNAAQNERLATQLGSQEKLQAAQLAAEKERQGLQISATERQQVRDLEAAMDRLNVQTNANKSMSEAQIASNEKLNANGLLSQENIARMNVASNDRDRAAANINAAQSTYAQMYSAIVGNKDIPASARSAYLKHAQAALDSNMALQEQIFGVDLTWQSSVNGNTASNGAGPGARSGALA